MNQTFYARVAAAVLSVISLLILRANLMIPDYAVSWFIVFFNLLLLLELAPFIWSGRSPAVKLFGMTGGHGKAVILSMGALNMLAAAVFFFWALAMAARTHASSDIIITAIQGIYIGALGVALAINSRCYRDKLEFRFHNLLLISVITYAVSVFMAARLLQGSIIMPGQLLASAMGNIVLAVLTMVVMNPSGNQGDRRDSDSSRF